MQIFDVQIYRLTRKARKARKGVRKQRALDKASVFGSYCKTSPNKVCKSSV